MEKLTITKEGKKSLEKLKKVVEIRNRKIEQMTFYPKYPHNWMPHSAKKD